VFTYCQFFPNFATIWQWSGLNSGPLNVRTSSTLKCQLLPSKIWSIWSWVFPLGEVQVYLWLFQCRSIVPFTNKIFLCLYMEITGINYIWPLITSPHILQDQLCFSLQPGHYSSLTAPNLQPTANQGMYNFRFTILINTNNTSNYQSTNEIHFTQQNTMITTHKGSQLLILTETCYQLQPSDK